MESIAQTPFICAPAVRFARSVARHWKIEADEENEAPAYDFIGDDAIICRAVAVHSLQSCSTCDNRIVGGEGRILFPSVSIKIY